MKLIFAAIATAFCMHAVNAAAFDGISVGLGLEYDPIAQLEYGNNSQPGLDVVDNITLEPGFFISFPTGFRVGGIFTYYGKNVDRGDTRASNLTSWGIGLLGDYGLEITESGCTFLVGGIEAGYSELTDKNEFNKRTSGGVWIAGTGGIRRLLTRVLFLEVDFRMRWLEYDFPDTPQKNYDYSGPTIRIALGYGLYSSQKNRSFQ